MVIAQEEHGLSRRRACRLIGISRSVVEREPKRARDHARLRERLRTLAGERRRFGYRQVRYLGLARNVGQLQVLCTAINLRRALALGLA